MGRPEYVEIFNDTMRLCGEDDELAKSVRKSQTEQYVLSESVVISLQGKPKDTPARVVVSPKRTFEAAEQYKDKKVCVLNFASARNPGGGVVRGASAQEECLCRISTLYPCLADSRIFSSFYEPHRRMFNDTLYNADLIFTPAVTVFKSDTGSPKLRPREEWFKADVITCAAPNLGSYTRVDDERLEEMHVFRGERVILTAINEGAEVLILGAFGCGAFRNPPEIVAKAYKRLTDMYAKYFDTIEFAVYCSSRNTHNFDVFNRLLR